MRILILVAVVIVGSLGFAFGYKKHELPWRKNHSVVWADFQGPVDRSSDHHASTHSGIRYSYNWSQRNDELTMKFEVESFFDRSKSWVKKDKRTKTLLAHEQLHFDITEIHARLLRKAFDEATWTKNFEEEVKEIAKENRVIRLKMQDAYDEETEHSQKKDVQAQWEEKIKELLEETDSLREK